MAHISVVTPVYKAEGCLEELYRRFVAALSDITEEFQRNGRLLDELFSASEDTHYAAQ